MKMILDSGIEYEVQDQFYITGRGSVFVVHGVIGHFIIGFNLVVNNNSFKIIGIERHPVPGSRSSLEKQNLGILVKENV